MAVATTIYEIDSSVEEDRPWINFDHPDNARQDWMMINAIIDNQLSVEGPLPIEVTVDSPVALDWDFYLLPGTPGMISERALHLLLPFASNHFRFMELR